MLNQKRLHLENNVMRAAQIVGVQIDFEYYREQAKQEAVQSLLTFDEIYTSTLLLLYNKLATGAFVEIKNLSDEHCVWLDDIKQVKC